MPSGLHILDLSGVFSFSACVVNVPVKTLLFKKWEHFKSDSDNYLVINQRRVTLGILSRNPQVYTEEVWRGCSFCKRAPPTAISRRRYGKFII